jgi:hypothetical protein
VVEPWPSRSSAVERCGKPRANLPVRFMFMSCRSTWTPPNTPTPTTRILYKTSLCQLRRDSVSKLAPRCHQHHCISLHRCHTLSTTRSHSRKLASTEMDSPAHA